MEYECASFHMMKRIELKTQPSCLLGLIWYSAQFADTQLQWHDDTMARMFCSRMGVGSPTRASNFCPRGLKWMLYGVVIVYPLSCWSGCKHEGSFFCKAITTTHRSCQRSTALGPLLQLRTGTSKLWSKQTVSLLSKEWPKIGGNRPTRLCLETLSTMKVSYIHGHGCQAFIDPHHLLDSCKLVVG